MVGQPNGNGPLAKTLRRLRLLVVEDHVDIAESMAMLLTLNGHQVRVVGDGPAALRAAGDEEPDIVLLDLGLPGMTGYEVAERLIARNPRKRPFLIAMTGFGSEDDRRHCWEAGIDLHMLKPVDMEQLEGVLNRFRDCLDE
jgi:two-component system CheB/CheR fusion protein